MKRLFLVLILFLFTVFAYADELKFRGLPFNSLIEDVIAQEGEPHSKSKIYPIIEGGTDLVYSNKMVASYNSVLSFYFNSIDRLVLGSYYIKVNPDFSNVQKEAYYLDAYHDLINKLKNLYGEPAYFMEPPSSYNPNDMCKTLWIYEEQAICLTLFLIDGYSLSLDYLSKQLTEQRYGTAKSSYGL